MRAPLLFLFTCFAIAHMMGNPASGQPVRLPEISRAAVPPAMAGDLIKNVEFSISPEQDYALCYSAKEARVWRLPDGELIYRYQDNKATKNSKDGTGGRTLRSVKVTGDKKYICVYDDKLIEAAEIETGEIVPDGLLLDSLRSGAYNIKRGFERERLPPAIYQSGTSPLWVKRKDYRNEKYNEQIEIDAVLADPQRPGSLLLFYNQGYCGSDQWIKDKTGRSVTDFRKKQEKANNCQFTDFHVARYDPASQKAIYLGNYVDRKARPDAIVRAIFPAPFDEAIAVGMQWDSAITVCNYRGEVLWRTDLAWRYVVVTGFDEAGRILITENRNGTRVNTVRLPLTGEVVTAYEVPPANQQLQMINRWKLMAEVTQDAAGDYTIALYDMKDGRLAKALTDAESAAAFSRRYRQKSDEYDRIVAEVTRRRNLQRQQEELARQKEYDRKMKENAARAAEHAKYWTICDACNGRGYNTTSGYSSGSSKTTHGTRRNTITGEISDYSETVTTPGGSYSTTTSCRRCRGKGEVARGF